MSLSRSPGVLSALAAALLFGIGTPIAKLLLGPIDPWLLAGLLYLGSGLGLALWRSLRKTHPVHLDHGETKWLAGAILAGGVIAPVLLMWGVVSYVGFQCGAAIERGRSADGALDDYRIEP